jgi:hypothetical protein
MAEYDVWNYTYGVGCRLVSPPFSPNGAAAHVGFALRKAYSQLPAEDSLKVEYSTDDGSTWSQVGFARPYDSAPVVPYWQLCDFELPPLSGSVRAAVSGCSDFGYVNIYVDDVRVYVPFPQDIGVLLVDNPVGHVQRGSAQPVAARVRNYGSDTASFLVRARVVHAAPPFDTVWSSERTVSNLPGGGTASVNLGDWNVPMTSDTWHVLVRALANGDSDPSNDEASAAVSSRTPRFGTVLALYAMGGSTGFANAGITWRQDTGRFYFVGMTPAPGAVWSFLPGDPVGTVANEGWQFLNLEGAHFDVPWGISWDEASRGFWITQVPDAINISCYAIRHGIEGRPGGTPADTWRLSPPADSLWFAGICGLSGSEFLTTQVGDSNRLHRLDLARKQRLNSLPGPAASYRACSRFAAGDTSWLLSGGWNLSTLFKLDTLGNVLDSALMPGLADCAVYVPRFKHRDSMVYGFATINAAGNPVAKFSLGVTWGDCGAAVIGDDAALPGTPDLEVPRPNPFAGRTAIRYTLPAAMEANLRIYSTTGRLIRTLLTGPQLAGRHRVFWNGRDDRGQLATNGIYFCRLSADGREQIRKTVFIR